jgi:glutamyl-tRNA synthetase
VIQRPDGTCLYHLASVVDDYDFRITHVVRAVEHLSNTPRQIFIAQGLGYPLPIYAHLPYVAEPGGSGKLSKRKLAQYLKNPDFAALNALGCRIMERTGRSVTAETFNPVIVDFYREIGFLPEAILNYLLLLGWSLDDSSEDFSRQQMLDAFTLERVTKAPASFDPQKLLAFQARWMQRLDIKKKVAMCLPYLQRAGLIKSPPPCSSADYLAAVLEAAGDRVKVAGEILDFDDFFLADDRLSYDPAAFEKRLVKDPRAVELLRGFRDELAGLEKFDAATTEAALKAYIERQQVKIGQIIHALRLAVTGKPVGFGMFETLAILGRERVLHRIDLALKKAGSE